jgi:hypothetical protein
MTAKTMSDEVPMTLMLELTPELEDRLRREALRRGLAPEDYARDLLKQHLPESRPDRPGDSLKALFASWEAEDRTDDPEEIARRKRDWEELARNLDRNRVDAGGTNVRRLFPWLEL